MKPELKVSAKIYKIIQGQPTTATELILIFFCSLLQSNQSLLLGSYKDNILLFCSFLSLFDTNTHRKLKMFNQNEVTKSCVTYSKLKKKLNKREEHWEFACTYLISYAKREFNANILAAWVWIIVSLMVLFVCLEVLLFSSFVSSFMFTSIAHYYFFFFLSILDIFPHDSLGHIVYETLMILNT